MATQIKSLVPPGCFTTTKGPGVEETSSSCQGHRTPGAFFETFETVWSLGKNCKKSAANLKVPPFYCCGSKFTYMTYMGQLRDMCQEQQTVRANFLRRAQAEMGIATGSSGISQNMGYFGMFSLIACHSKSLRNKKHVYCKIMQNTVCQK